MLRLRPGVAAVALAAVLGAACAGGNRHAPEVEEPASPARMERLPASGPLLWRLVSPEGAVSFVLGTIHVGVAAAELSPAVWQALEGSNVFVMETDVDATRPSGGHGPALGEALRADSWARFEALVGSARAARLASADVSLGWAAVLQALYPAHESMDVSLARSASDRGMQIHYLEDWQLQLELGRKYFDLRELEELLDPASGARRDLKSLVEAYRRGDVRALEALALEPEQVASAPRRFDDLFFARNRRWAEQMAPWLRQQRCFIAVGAGHLVGDRGLLSLLRARGFSVQRITPESP